jgi:hypothetical protein
MILDKAEEVLGEHPLEEAAVEAVMAQVEVQLLQI